MSQVLGRSVTDEVFARIRADILSGQMAPGDRLKFAALQQRYGASAASLREALMRLADQSLVLSQPRIGFMVAPLAREDLIDLTEARVQLECLVFELAIKHGSMQWEGDVVAAHHVLERLPVYVDSERTQLSAEWSEAHDAFHIALLAGCPIKRLRDYAALMRDSAALYRAWSQTRTSARDRDVAHEHRELRDCVIERDAERGRSMLAKHVQFTTDLLLANIPE